jgi:fumarate reductase flavoprotein subunit
MKKKHLLVTAILICYMFILTGCSKESKWNDGDFAGTAKGMHGDMEVNVTIEDGKISKIDVLTQDETEGLGTVAIEKVSEEIIDSQKTEVDTVSGATESSKTIIAAVEDALSKAVK